MEIRHFAGAAAVIKGDEELSVRRYGLSMCGGGASEGANPRDSSLPRRSLKRLINEALRRSLDDVAKRRKPGERMQTHAVALGRVRVASIDNIAETLAIVEGHTPSPHSTRSTSRS